MHSSFPRKDQGRGYGHVAARESIRHWITRVVRMSSLRLIVSLIVSIFILAFLFWRGRWGQHVNGNHVPVVLVTVLDGTRIEEQRRIIDKVLENREEYANAHGYQMALYNSSEYPMYYEDEGVWTKLAALRDAMTEHPESEWFWYLDQNAIIMNPSISLHIHYLSPSSLLALPLRDVPLFPSETTIRTPTLRTQSPSQINLILNHGGGILHTGSILLRRGDYANFVLDSWNDPLIRNYGFPGEDYQAFEHLIQWHPTILEGLALMPKRSLLSFGVAAGDDEQYHEGDFVVHLDGCEETGRSCEKEFMRYWAQRGSLTFENEQIPPKPNKLIQRSENI